MPSTTPDSLNEFPENLFRVFPNSTNRSESDVDVDAFPRYHRALLRSLAENTAWFCHGEPTVLFT